jgi:hypothetical protein
MIPTAHTDERTGGGAPRDPTGRFAAGLGLHELLDAVAEIARSAATEAGVPPASVSKGAWDRARIATGREDVPTAEGVRKRLDRKWSDVLAVALGPPSERLRRLGVLAGRPVFSGDKDVTLRAIVWAAQQVRHSPRPAEYDLAIEEWNRRARRDPHRPMLPVSESILERMTWPEAIRRAGLGPLRAPGARRADPLAQLIDRCISETGVVPTKPWFRQWARLNDIRVGRQIFDQWRSSLAEALRLRRRRGEPIPGRTQQLPELPAAPSRRARRRTREDALRSLRVYTTRYLRAGEPPRSKHYQVSSAGDPDLVSTAVLARFGRFQDLCREAGL